MRRGISRVLAIGTVGLAAGAWACARPAPAGPTPVIPAQSLRVMTYNIHHGAGNDDCGTPVPPPGSLPQADCGLNLERIAAVIRGADVDVAGLQEVDRFWARSGDIDQTASLGAMLNMQTCYGANLRHGPDSHSGRPHEYGTLILSRHPLAGCENMLLPRAGPATEQRGLLKAVIRVGLAPLDFYNTHLHTAEADRRVQVEAIVQRLGAPAGPAILVGDLNARPAEPYLAPLFAVLADAWTVAGSGTGATSPARPGEPARNRIDYVLVSKGMTVAAAATLVTPQTAMASDHYPVIADVVIAR